MFLAILKALQDPSSLALLELAISISLDGEHPSTHHEVLGLELADVDEVKNIVVKPRLDFSRIRLNKELGVDSELLQGIFFSGPMVASSCQCPFIHVEQ